MVTETFIQYAIQNSTELFIVISGRVAKCQARTIDGNVYFLQTPYDGTVRAKHRELGYSQLINNYVFETREEAQGAVLSGSAAPTALTWESIDVAPRPKVYLAGFHVFRLDGKEYGQRMRELCKEYGFEGVYPADNEPYDNLDKKDIAKMIFYLNEGLIRDADIVIANLNTFRGVEPDSGTVFEVGFGYALEKKLYAYISDGRSMYERLKPSINYENGTYEDGMKVEDFDLPLNLMLSVPVEVVVGSFEDCLKKVHDDYYNG